MTSRWHLVVLALFSAAQSAIAAPDSVKRKIELTAESRLFPQRGFDSRQTDATLSLAVLGRWDLDWRAARAQLAVVPFARIDSADSERSHVDLREFELRYRTGNLDFRAGIGKVFWGTTEFVHLVDVINQTDGVESIDNEEKLGQPILGLSWTSPIGVLTGLVMPLFRERNLQGVKGRLRAPLPYAQSRAMYESDRGKKHVDFALRWQHSSDSLDIGIAHFVGTAREPGFLVQTAAPEPNLLAVYDQIRQTSLDLNWVSGSWIWKLEALQQRHRNRDYSAAVGGFEYTLPNSEVGARETGLLLEYAWDSRGLASGSPVQNDLFVGLRIALNDVAGSELLAGFGQDMQSSGRFVSLDASRRIGDSGRFSLKLRLIDSSAEADPLTLLNRDDHLVLEYTRFL
jgi:hypothetical protein